jgi:subtilisin family serine protease
MSCIPSGGSKPTGEEPEIPAPGVSDPLAIYAWHLENTGQSTFSSSGGKAGEDMNIKEVHDMGIKGKGIRIAVSDTGVEVAHPDLYDNQLIGFHRNYSSDDASTWRGGNPYPIEDEAHGTAVSGLMSAVGWNGIGSRGVAPESKYGGFLYIGNFHDSDSSYEAKTLDQMTGDFDIFNYSYGYDGCEFVPATADVLAAYRSGVTSLRSNKGAIYIQSAGNEYASLNSYCHADDDSYFLGNTNTSEDHNHPFMILVGAVNALGDITSYSSPGSGVWISAAGGEYGDDDPAMLTTDLQGCKKGYSSSTSSVTGFNKGNSTLNSKCNYTSIMNGTSSAAPVLSGIIALMLEANPNLSWRDVKHILAMTANKGKFRTQDLTHPFKEDLPGHTYDDLFVENAAKVKFSNTYGFGRVDAQAAVQMAKTYTFPLGTFKETSFYTSGDLNLSIPDKSASGVTHTLTVNENYSIEAVQIKITTNHPFIGDLGVELISPRGTKSKLLLINSNIKDSGLSNFTLLTNAFYKETSQGQWILKIIDGKTGNTGKLQNWKIKVSGH